jgi:hypothetical protein
MLQSCRKLDCITSPKVTDGSSLMLTSIVPDPTMSVAEPPSGRAAVRRRAASTPCENGQMERGGGYQAGLAQDGDERIGRRVAKRAASVMGRSFEPDRWKENAAPQILTGSRSGVG